MISAVVNVVEGGCVYGKGGGAAAAIGPVCCWFCGGVGCVIV
jgi:hypothetical protein